MGASLGTFRHSSSESRQPKATNSKASNSSSGSSILELIKAECLKRQKMINKKRQLHQPEKQLTKMRKLTLEEWILSSPGPKRDGISGGELYILKNFSKKVHPSSSRVHSAFSSISPRDSLSFDRLMKLDDEGALQDLEVSSMSRSQSGKQKKKVSFRMPEESDIIIFHSPEEKFE